MEKQSILSIIHYLSFVIDSTDLNSNLEGHKWKMHRNENILVTYGFREQSHSLSDMIHNYFKALANIQIVLNFNSITFFFFYPPRLDIFVPISGSCKASLFVCVCLCVWVCFPGCPLYTPVVWLLQTRSFSKALQLHLTQTPFSVEILWRVSKIL